VDKNDEVMAILVEARDAIEAAMDVLYPPQYEETLEAPPPAKPPQKGRSAGRYHKAQRGK